jgi:hypothetical protein
MMNFFDTVRGHNLADTLIRELPQIRKELKRQNDLKEKELKYKLQSGEYKPLD